MYIKVRNNFILEKVIFSQENFRERGDQNLNVLVLEKMRVPLKLDQYIF